MKRPIAVTLTFGMVLTIAIWNAIKAWTYLSWRSTLEEFTPRFPPILGVLSGVIWFIIGLSLAWGLWQMKPWSAKGLQAGAAGYLLWYWIERLAWQAPHPNFPYVIALDIAIIILIYITSKSLSREAYERNIENPAVE